MIKRSTNTQTELVKAVTSNKTSFDQITKDGFIYLGSTRVRASPWRFGVKPNQCHNCQKFGHSKEWCNLKDPVCLRCKNNHRHRECNITDESQFVCANCDGNHSAVSRKCPKMIEETKRLEQKSKKEVKEGFTRIESAFKQNNQIPKYQRQNTTTQKQPQSNQIQLVSLIIDLFKNINKVREALENGDSYIGDIVKHHLGNETASLITTAIAKTQHNTEENEEENSNYIEDD